MFFEYEEREPTFEGGDEGNALKRNGAKSRYSPFCRGGDC